MLQTAEQHAQALKERGIDIEAVAIKALRIAKKRGTVTAGLAGGTSVICAKALGYLRKDRRFKGDSRYRLTKTGRQALEKATN